MFEEEGYLLRLYFGESDKHDGIALYEWIVRRARDRGLAGATVFRGIEGFGTKSRIHTAKLLTMTTDLPVVVEITDYKEKVEAFLPELEEVVKEGLATVETVKMRLFRKTDHQPDHQSDHQPDHQPDH